MEFSLGFVGKCWCSGIALFLLGVFSKAHCRILVGIKALIRDLTAFEAHGHVKALE